MNFVHLSFNEVRKTDFKEGRICKSILFNGSVGQGTFFVKNINGKIVFLYKDIVGGISNTFICSLSKFIEVA